MIFLLEFLVTVTILFILDLLGVKIGTAVIIVGVISLILALFYMIELDMSEKILTFCLLTLPSVLIIIWGISISDKMLWNVLSGVFFNY